MQRYELSSTLLPYVANVKVNTAITLSVGVTPVACCIRDTFVVYCTSIIMTFVTLFVYETLLTIISHPSLKSSARMGQERGVYRVLVGKPEGKRPLGRPRHRWEDNIKIDLQEVGGGLCGLDGVGSG